MGSLSRCGQVVIDESQSRLGRYWSSSPCSPRSPRPRRPASPLLPSPNPDLTKACGLDVLMIIDESGSISNSGATNDVRNAFRAFVASLKNTGSKMSVAEFSTVARLPSIGGLPAGTYITIDDTTEAGFETYIQGYNPNGWTNWEDALRVGSLLRPPAQRRHPPPRGVPDGRRPDRRHQQQQRDDG